MLPIAIITAIILMLAIIIVIMRALDYISQHPEVLTNNRPLSYQRCHITLSQVIERYKRIESQITSYTVTAWQSPSGYLYTVNREGVQQRRDIFSNRDVYCLRWGDIGGVGVRMQPGFKPVDYDRDGRTDRLDTIGYAFYLLIVPLSGDTINVQIPTDDREDAVDFVAHTLALAGSKNKRINLFGFDKPPAPPRQKVPKV